MYGNCVLLSFLFLVACFLLANMHAYGDGGFPLI
jgi:hypothetical protein